MPNLSLLKAQELESLFIQKQYNRIENLTAKKIESGTMHQQDYYWLSLSLEQLERPYENLKILQAGNEQFPKDTSLTELLAFAYYEMGDYKMASPLLAELKSADSQIKLARIKEFYNQTTDALQIYESLLEADEDNLFLIKRIAHNYYKIDSFPKAIHYLDYAIGLYKSDIESLYLLSKAYEKSENYEKSLEIASIALDIDSSQTNFLRQAGKANFQMKDYQKASDFFMQCYALNDTALFVQKLFGISNHQIEANLAAEVLLKSAYRKDSANFEVCYFLGRTLKALRKYHESIEYLQKAYELIQPNTDNLIAYHVEMVIIRKQLKQYQKMYEEYQILYELSKDPVYVYYMGSTAQYYLKNKAMAFRHYETYLKLTPDDVVEEPQEDADELSLSIRKVAKENYELLKKERFFEGNLE
jgi:tetratricopeptide (TPR) repeat protein